MGYVKGLLSVLCGCYNHEKFVEDCIQSIWDNDYKNVEIIVLDDGSTDKSVEILQRLKEKSPCPFKIITQENTHNIGLNGNRSLSAASGEFVTFMSTDDYYTTDAFSSKLILMQEDSQIAFTVSRRVYSKTEEGITLTDPVGERFNSDTSIDEMCEIEYKEGTFAVQGNIFRREVIDAVHGFDEDIYGDDIVIRTKVLKYMQNNPGYKFKVIEKPSFIYRIHDNNYTKDSTSMVKIFMDNYDRYWNDRPYPDYVKNIFWDYLLKNNFDKFYPIFIDHPKVLKMIYENKMYMNMFCLKLSQQYFHKLKFWYIFRKERIDSDRIRFVILNFIKIGMREKIQNDKNL